MDFFIYERSRIVGFSIHKRRHSRFRSSACAETELAVGQIGWNFFIGAMNCQSMNIGALRCKSQLNFSRLYLSLAAAETVMFTVPAIGVAS